jgi:L-threonylcarbamoyladenylate synthase
LEFEQDILRCLEILHAGGTILYPTDTIWGLGCDATNDQAVNKIFGLKRRKAAKSMIVLLADPRDINIYSSRPEPYILDYVKKTTRPTTIIYEGALGLADNLVADDGSVAIRVVKEDFCRHLIKRFRKPIVSTSANISGDQTPSCFIDISPEIINGADYVVRYRREDDRPAKASALIRFSKDGKPVFLRT